LPRIIGNQPADRWENEVLKAFKNQLPDDWVVMPSVMWTLKKNGYVRDGEADFVVLVPDSGLIVVEVKGSKEFKVAEDGVWLRKAGDGSWVRLGESPPEQATRNMHDLTNVLSETTPFPGRYAYLVIYPQGEAASLPAMFDESTIATRRHMNKLASKLRTSLELRGGENKASQFTSSAVESVIDHLKNRKFRVQKVDAGDEVADDIDKIEQLTRQQFASLKGLFQLPSVAVIGPAGSGKTILAIWRLQALIEQGARAIYVCYNTTLANSLRLKYPDYAKFINNVDRLFVEICPIKRGKIDENSFYREVLPGYVIEKSDTYEKYDSVIIDEGQDFSEEQVIAMLDLQSSEGTWAFFADWNQNLYDAGMTNPIGADVVFHLHHNCRNTVKINDASNSYLNSRVESMPGMPLGVPPLIEYAGNQSKRAWELAKQWSGEGSIAILSPFKLENSAMKGQECGHGLRLSTDIKDLGTSDTVYFSTIKSFKGIEAAVVIVVDVCKPGTYDAFKVNDLYVACTRATTRLALLSSKKDVIDYFGKN
jgi:hypothetical protein